MGQGTQLGQASGSITISTAQLEQALAAARQFATAVERSLGRLETSTVKTEKRFAGLNSVLMKVGTVALAAIGLNSVRVGMELAKAGARAEQLSQRFNFMAKTVGESGETMLKSLRAASRDHIADVDLMLSANRALLLGVASNSDEMGDLMRVAGVRAGAMGMTFEQAFSDIVLGVGRLSVPILDNLGIMIDSTEAYERYAESIGKVADKLTEQERRQAFVMEIMRQSEPLLALQESQGVSPAGRLQQAEAAAKNARIAFAQLFTSDVVEVTIAWTSALQKLTTWLEKAKEAAGGGGMAETLIRAAGGFTEQEKKTADANKEIVVLTSMLSNAEEGLVRLQEQFAQGIVDESDVRRQIGVVKALRDEIAATKREVGTLSNAALINVGIYQRQQAIGVRGSAMPASSVTPRFSGDEGKAQLNLIRDRYTGLQDIERDANKARLDTTRQYEEQRTNVIRDYGKMMSRDAEDFARSRARAQADLEKSIASIVSDSAKQRLQWESDLAERFGEMSADRAERRAEQQADLEERIADLQEDTAERRTEIEEDYAKNRLRAERQHRETLMGAASRLDATAVLWEQRRWAQAGKDQEEAHREQLDELDETLAERLSDEQENYDKRQAQDDKAYDKQLRQMQKAHDRQLEEQAINDAERIEEMRTDLADRQLIEDEDRAIRLARQAADHGDRLAEMDRQHALDLAQISTQEAESRAKLQTEFETAMAELGIQTSQRETAWKRITDAAIKEYDRWFENMEDKAKLLANPGPREAWPSLGDPLPRNMGFAAGGYVPRTGSALVHAGEFVLSRAMLASMEKSSRGSGGGAMGGVTFNGNISLSVAGSTNMGASEMYGVARMALVDALKEISQ